MNTEKKKGADAQTTGAQNGKRKKTSAIVIIAILLLWSSPIWAWTLTASGTIRTDPNFGGADYFSPFKNGNQSLVELAYSLTIQTNPALNGHDGSDPATHYTLGGTVTPFAGAPYIMKLTVAGQDFTLIEMFPASNQSSLSASQVFQQIYSNGCTVALYSLCIETYIVAPSPIAFTTNFDFEQMLKIPGKIFNPFPVSRVFFKFRNGPYGSLPTQQNSYFEGSIDDLQIRRDAK